MFSSQRKKLKDNNKPSSKQKFSAGHNLMPHSQVPPQGVIGGFPGSQLHILPSVKYTEGSVPNMMAYPAYYPQPMISHPQQGPQAVMQQIRYNNNGAEFDYSKNPSSMSGATYLDNSSVGVYPGPPISKGPIFHPYMYMPRVDPGAQNIPAETYQAEPGATQFQRSLDKKKGHKKRKREENHQQEVSEDGQPHNFYGYPNKLSAPVHHAFFPISHSNLQETPYQKHMGKVNLRQAAGKCMKAGADSARLRNELILSNKNATPYDNCNETATESSLEHVDIGFQFETVSKQNRAESGNVVHIAKLSNPSSEQTTEDFNNSNSRSNSASNHSNTPNNRSSDTLLGAEPLNSFTSGNKKHPKDFKIKDHKSGNKGEQAVFAQPSGAPGFSPPFYSDPGMYYGYYPPSVVPMPPMQGGYGPFIYNPMMLPPDIHHNEHVDNGKMKIDRNTRDRKEQLDIEHNELKMKEFKQRAKFKAKLHDLRNRLKDAELRNQQLYKDDGFPSNQNDPSHKASHEKNKVAMDTKSSESDDTKPKRKMKSKNKKPGSSKFRGVSWHKRDKSYVARIWLNGKSEHLGVYREELRAALAVDEKLLSLDLRNRQDLNFKSQLERDIVLSVLENNRRIRQKKEEAKQKHKIRNSRKTEKDVTEEEDSFSTSSSYDQSTDSILEVGVSKDKNGNPNSIEHVLSNILQRTTSENNSVSFSTESGAQSSSNASGNSSDEKSSSNSNSNPNSNGSNSNPGSNNVGESSGSGSNNSSGPQDRLKSSHKPFGRLSTILALNAASTNEASTSNLIPDSVVSKSSEYMGASNKSTQLVVNTNTLEEEEDAYKSELLTATANAEFVGPSPSDKNIVKTSSSVTGPNKIIQESFGEVHEQSEQWSRLLKAAASQYLPSTDRQISSSPSEAASGYVGDRDGGSTSPHSDTGGSTPSKFTKNQSLSTVESEETDAELIKDEKNAGTKANQLESRNESAG